jgi:hypothetical protein
MQNLRDVRQLRPEVQLSRCETSFQSGRQGQKSSSTVWNLLGFPDLTGRSEYANQSAERGAPSGNKSANGTCKRWGCKLPLVWISRPHGSRGTNECTEVLWLWWPAPFWWRSLSLRRGSMRKVWLYPPILWWNWPRDRFRKIRCIASITKRFYPCRLKPRLLIRLRAVRGTR